MRMNELIAKGFKAEYQGQRAGGYKFHRLTDILGQGRLDPKNDDLLWDLATACEGHHYGYRIVVTSQDYNTIELCIYID